MSALPHGQAHAAGNLAAPCASLGRVQRIAEWRQHKAVKAACVNEALNLLREHFTTDVLVHQAICTLSAAASDKKLQSALAMFADEIDPTPAYGDDGEAA